MKKKYIKVIMWEVGVGVCMDVFIFYTFRLGWQTRQILTVAVLTLCNYYLTADHALKKWPSLSKYFFIWTFRAVTTGTFIFRTFETQSIQLSFTSLIFSKRLNTWWLRCHFIFSASVLVWSTCILKNVCKWPFPADAAI